MNKISGKIINHNSSYTGTIEFSDKLESINKEKNSDFENIIIPGFVDLHCHGGNGLDTMAGISSIKEISKYHLKHGTTTLLPTTLTASFDDTINAVEGIDDFIDQNINKTNILGVHLEGPFINPNKLGAQPPFTQLPNIDFIKKIKEKVKIKVITLAPELEGAEACIDYLIENNIRVQIGHSLADYNCCMKIMNKNNVGFTHLYNAMSGDDHRNPGVVTAALRHAEYAEIICDLHHVNKENIHLADKCIPKLYAITDAISATGMPDGDYDFSHTKISKRNGQAVINSTVLAGSVINMHDTLKNLVKINFSMEKAVAMTSFNAAQYLGENNKGKIDKGFTANLIVLDKELNIRKVYLNGNLIS